MQDVADRVLADLGLAEHQALMVAHQDRAHPHVHLMVNRVHPETGVAWERWQDRPRIERTLRELERELGLREVAGRLYQLDGQEAPEPALLTSGERRQAERTGEPAFPDRVRAHLPELRAARSWTELEDRLAAHGLRLERKGQGLVITDGTHQVKASRVARDLSLRRLEERFRTPYPGREEEQARREPPSRDVTQLQGALAEYERVAALEHERDRGTKELYAAQARRSELDHAITAVRAAEKDFDRALARVYRDPPAAREQFRNAVAHAGPERAAEWLTAEPERFGALRTVDRRRALGLGVRRDEAPARLEARRAASYGRALAETERRAAALAGREAPDRQSSVGPWVERALAHVKERIGETERLLDQLKQELRRAPHLELLQRSIARVVARLEAREIAQLRLLVTAPQVAIAFQARRVLKDLLLGREEEREE